ncbi:Chitin bind 4 domain containing protein, partial [Asbolus verrucosus]
FLLCAFAASVFADVSHVLNRPFSRSPPRVLPVAPNPATRSSGQVVPTILRQSQDLQPDGSYEFSYETDNGIAVEERAEVRSTGRDEVEKSAQGSYSWTSPEGERISIAYLADANGFQPQGSHLPVAPPIPVAIQRALDWIAAHPQPIERDNSVRIGQRRY